MDGKYGIDITLADLRTLGRDYVFVQCRKGGCYRVAFLRVGELIQVHGDGLRISELRRRLRCWRCNARKFEMAALSSTDVPRRVLRAEFPGHPWTGFREKRE